MSTRITVDNSSTGYIDTNGGKLVLPVGVHAVVYTTFDACGNSSENSYTVTVETIYQSGCIYVINSILLV